MAVDTGLSSSSTTGNANQIDRRARLSAKPLAADIVYGQAGANNILNPIIQTNGMVFPYTPSISDPTVVQYDSYDLVHSNQPYAAFKSVGPRELSVSGVFTASNQAESLYCLASIHFMRTVTKMYFGYNANLSAGANSLRGTPPPILLFNAYGTAMYYNVPVIVTGYTLELPNDVDYVYTDLSNGGSATMLAAKGGTTISNLNGTTQTVSNGGDINAWIPTKFTLNVSLQVQNTPDRWRRQFNLDDFRTGNLIKKGGWI